MTYDMILFLLLGIAIGVLISLVYADIRDRYEEKKLKKRCAKVTEENLNWCIDGCKYYEQALAENKDHYEAIAWLDNNHCENCPIATSIDFMIANDLDWRDCNENQNA